MRPRVVVRYEDRLSSFFDRVHQIEDDELRAHWARYLCVLTCGYLEVSIPAIYAEYAGGKAAPEVSRFVQRKLERFASPNHANILSLSSSFNPEWESELSAFIEGQIKDHINSVVANRHSIAHGKDTGVTVVRVKEWYQSATQIVRKIEAQCGL